MVAHASSLGISSQTFVSKWMTKNLDPENTSSNALSSVTMLRMDLFYTSSVPRANEQPTNHISSYRCQYMGERSLPLGSREVLNMN